MALGRAYRDGRGVAADPQRARQWLSTRGGRGGDRRKQDRRWARPGDGRGPAATALGSAAEDGDSFLDEATGHRRAPDRPTRARQSALCPGCGDSRRGRATPARGGGAGAGPWSPATASPKTTDPASPGLIRAAEGGDTGAMANLGQRYLTGDGVRPDPTRALEYLVPAAEAGDADAMAAIGTALISGDGVERDVPGGAGSCCRRRRGRP